ncbi:similar to RIBOSOMAL RNA PROCESSING 5 [Actinidia rufa]|uniref:Similar to RIBOSOMAL RNA PROCESSING 5 n=1 Tax=Actinidia rufa TaxID=165716 RepID=A0A7J0F6Q4_9ERIC|nr:similar to RIBOSOMAL RNA PROCESSING 5 [Actinidia rufa]
MAPPSKNSPKKSKHALNKFQKPSKQSFKPKSKSDHAVKSQEVALQLEDDEPDFPRGGGSSLSKEELDEVRAEVDAEGRGLKKKKSLPTQSHSAEDDLGSLFGGRISGKLPRFANRITWKNVTSTFSSMLLNQNIEVTLKTPNASSAQKSYISGSLKAGDIVFGWIKCVESYGLFITVDDTNMVGLCHVSELSDDPVDNIESKYRAGEKVTVKVDEDRHRISLGMKNSYFAENYDVQAPSKQKSDDEDDENDHMVDTQLNMLPGSGSSGIQNFDIEYENEEHPVLADVEARASILPLEVPLDDIENSGMDDVICQSKGQVDYVDAKDEKSKRQAKRKEKEEREREIRAAEERLLEKDVPRSADEFEKLVRSSPNSSFVWIKYMAFVLSLADVENARTIAERALKTITIREETEKLNIWVAYFNLENEYGNPPGEAVQKIFQRALQYCDPKKVHLALLGMYERTEQPKLADDLLNKMIRKFKHSCKVWLRRIQWLLKQNRDEVQSVVKRAVLCLPQHKHIKFLSQTAILEFKCGVLDRGRSMFEGMLREYPKRNRLVERLS